MTNSLRQYEPNTIQNAEQIEDCYTRVVHGCSPVCAGDLAGHGVLALAHLVAALCKGLALAVGDAVVHAEVGRRRSRGWSVSLTFEPCNT